MIDQLPQEQKSRIHTETLHVGEQILFSFELGKVQLYKEPNGKKGPLYQLTWDRSAMAMVPSDPVNTKLTWFKHRLSRITTSR